MATEAVLRVTRTATRLASSRTRPWDVVVDGVIVGQVSHDKAFVGIVDPGHHSLRIASSKILYSPLATFDARGGQVVDFTCRANALSPIVFTRWIVWLLMSLVKHDLWIGLRYADTTATSGATEGGSSAMGSGGRVADESLSASAARTAVAQAVGPLSDHSTLHSVGESALVVEHLTKRFGDRTAFSDVSFSVGYGEVFGFLGPNGAGKTTTVRTLGTLIAPTSGSATVAGIPLWPDNGVEIRQRIAVMPEAPGLYLRLTVFENLEFFAGLFGLRHADQRIKEALEAVNLGDRAGDLCGGLSKGLRQRVGLARTLLSNPAIMFLDEPTSGLDPVASLDVLNLISGLRQQGVTIFLTTHRLDEAEKLCDRVAIMNTTLRTVGTPEDLRERLFQKTLAVRTLTPLAEPDSVFAHLPGVDGWHLDGPATYVVSVSDATVAAPNVTRALVGAGADVLAISETQHSLEDIYLQLVDQSSTQVSQ